ncbi:MAG: hypothetical protein AB7F99_20160 [Vicinamibacterales bacterium]
MTLKITHRNGADVPSPNAQGVVNENLQAVRAEMSKLAPGMVLEIEAGSPTAVRSTKMLVSRAAKQLNTEWQHWNNGTTVYAKPRAGTKRRRGHPPATD